MNNNKTIKYKVGTKDEVAALSKIFSWTEIFDTCHISSGLLSHALALSQMHTARARDSTISQDGFKMFFMDNNVLEPPG